MSSDRSCDPCLRRAWLLARLSGHLDAIRSQIAEALALPDRDLIDAVAGKSRGRVLAEYDRLDPAPLRRRCNEAGVVPICRCDSRYPARLRSLTAPPAVLHVAGAADRFCELVAEEPVAIVGARRASGYGLDVARSLARGLAAAKITVVSGLALGIDSAAHAGALAAAGPTIAVLPGGPDRPYPAAKRALYERIRDTGAAISELPPAVPVRRWMFPARNRIIAALCAMTVVVEAAKRSGALLTAAHARELGRTVGATPGRVTSPTAAGPHRLLRDGATLVRGPQDVLDALFGAGARAAPDRVRTKLAPELDELLTAIGQGHDTIAALTRTGIEPSDGFAALSALEVEGYVRREAGGRYVVLP